MKNWNKKDWAIFIVLFLFCWPALIVFMVMNWDKKDEPNVETPKHATWKATPQGYERV